MTLPPSSTSHSLGPVVVSGATGKTSRAAIAALVAHNIPVRALVRNPAKAADLLPKSDLVEIYHIDDLSDLDTLTKAYTNARGAYIITPGLSVAFRLVGTQAQAAKKAKVPQVVFLSSALSTYPEQNTIGQVHALCEQFFVLFQFPSFTALCPDAFYSNLEHQKGAMASTGKVVNLAFDARIPSIDTADVGAVAAQIFADGPEKHHQKRYILTCERDQAKTTAEMVAIVGGLLGKDLEAVATEAEIWQESVKAFVDGYDLQAMIQFASIQRKSFRPHEDVRKVLGRAPRSFEEYARDNIANYRM